MLDTHLSFTGCIHQNHTEIANDIASEFAHQVIQWDQIINRCGQSIQMKYLSKLSENKDECLSSGHQKYIDELFSTEMF